MTEKSRYIIGIDLGTTNSSVAYIDTDSKTHPKLSVQSFRIPQLSKEGFMEGSLTLPSFCYIFPGQSYQLPWHIAQSSVRPYVVGKMAQTEGGHTPTRLVQSAKSWLCNTAADRRDKLLPIEAADSSIKISPVEASARYLTHIRESWNYVMRQGDIANEFEQQDIVLTVPASFDEVARTLTVEAAKLAGFAKLTLLEEPQAAFYSWIAQQEMATLPFHENLWEKLQPGQRILVCDVGGGTTDFSMIEVLQGNENIAFQRMAVGDHLLLGGDNMDTMLTHLLESQLKTENGKELTHVQWLQLLHQARKAKETLLDESSDTAVHRLFIQGSGSKLMQGSVTTEISQSTVRNALLNGFFGQYAWEQAIQLRKTSGFRTMGLPYADDPSITKQLAYFLWQNKLSAPDFVLFNGGSLKPKLFQEAILSALKSWFPQSKPTILPSVDLDLAVSKGAAYFGKVRRGAGIRISGGTACGYYLKVDVKDSQPAGKMHQQALTLLPRGAEEGSTYKPPHLFWLIPNQPVAFQLLTSHVRLSDKPGTLLPIDPLEFKFLPPIHTILRYGKGQDTALLPVSVGISLTEIGTLEMWLTSEKTTHRWTLEFQLRMATGEENTLATIEKGRADETFDSTHLSIHLAKACTVIENTFGANRTLKPDNVIEKLEEALLQSKQAWAPSILRGLWPTLYKQAPFRNASPKHAARWWNLAGYLLRPGFGYPLDDFRIKELWKIILSDLKEYHSQEAEIQMWICYRRIAGGLSKGQQIQLASHIFPTLINKKNGKIEVQDNKERYPFSEKMRTLSAMELLDHSMKTKLAHPLVAHICANIAENWQYWCLARIGARHLIYGSIAHVVERETCRLWVESIIDGKSGDKERVGVLLGSLARKSAQRECNLPEETHFKVLKYLEGHSHKLRLEQLINSEVTLTDDEQNKLFGEELPAGLLLER